MSHNERFVEPNFLITTVDNAVGRKQRKKRRRRGRDAVYAKVGLRKDPIDRINIEPSEILVPAALPPEIEEQQEIIYAFSSMMTYNQRKKKNMPKSEDNVCLTAQQLYSSTRVTFANDHGKAKAANESVIENEDEDSYHGDDAISHRGGSLHEGSSTLSSFPSFSDTASHGMGIASRAMKLVATGASSSFGRSERFAEESNRRKNRRIDRFYDVDGGVKCSISKSVNKSLFGTAMAHNDAPRFPKKSPKLSQPANVGPGSYKVTQGLISKKIQDRWDLQSSSFRGIQRNKTGVADAVRKRSGGSRVGGSDSSNNNTKSLPTLARHHKSPFSKSKSKSDEIMSRKSKAGQEIREQRVTYARQHNMCQTNNSSMSPISSSSLLPPNIIGSPRNPSLNQPPKTPEQRLSQASWKNQMDKGLVEGSWIEEQQVISPLSSPLGTRKGSSTIYVGKTPVVSPEGSIDNTIDGFQDKGGSGFVTLDSLPGAMIGGMGSGSIGNVLGKVTPQGSIASIVSVNEYMEDKF